MKSLDVNIPNRENTYTRQVERARHLSKTILVRVFARLVHVGIGWCPALAGRARLLSSGMSRSAICTSATPPRHLVDRHDAVGVVRREFRVQEHLGDHVAARVDQAERVEMQLRRGFAVPQREEGVLQMEVVGECGAVVVVVGFGPDGEFVVGWLVLGEAKGCSRGAPCLEGSRKNVLL